jgi:hypothetical protein
MVVFSCREQHRPSRAGDAGRVLFEVESAIPTSHGANLSHAHRGLTTVTVTAVRHALACAAADSFVGDIPWS